MAIAVFPRREFAIIYEAGGARRRVSGDDVIDGADVLPGFRCRVAEFFPY